MPTLLKDWDVERRYTGCESMCPTMWGMGTGYHLLSKPEWNLSPPGRHPEGRVGVFGFGNHGHDVHDGHVDTVRLSHARLTGLAWPKRRHH